MVSFRSENLVIDYFYLVLICLLIAVGVFALFFLHYYCNNLEQNGGGDVVPSVALPYLFLICFLSNSHTVVYKNLFIVDPS